MTKRVSQSIAALALTLGFLAGPLVGDGVAQSQYPPGAGRCRVEINRVPRNGFLRRITIRVLCPSLGIRIRISVIIRSEPTHVGTFTTDENGRLDATVTLPDSVEPGSHHLELFQASPSASPVAGPPHLVAGQAVVGSPLESIPLTVRGSGEDKSVLVGEHRSPASSPASRSSSGGTSPGWVIGAAVGLVVVGAGGGVTARRRRSSTATPHP